MFYRIVKLAAQFLTALLFGLRAYGQHRIPARGGVLLAANHQSYLDPIIVGVSASRPLSYMARDTLFKHRHFRRLISNLNTFPVQRERLDRAAMAVAVGRLKAGQALLVFPESRRSEDGSLGRLRAGAAMLAAKAGVPLLPVAVAGTFSAWPRHRKLPRCRHVAVSYGTLVHVEGRDRKAYEAAMRSVEAQIRVMSARLAQRKGLGLMGKWGAGVMGCWGEESGRCNIPRPQDSNTPSPQYPNL